MTWEGTCIMATIMSYNFLSSLPLWNQHYSRDSNQCNKTAKRNKMHLAKKESIKTSLVFYFIHR